MRKSSGALHYFINGVDQGVATARTPQPVWGVVDLYGMAVQVTVVDSDAGSLVCHDNIHDNVMANDVTQRQTDSHIDSSKSPTVLHCVSEKPNPIHVDLTSSKQSC